MSNLIEVIKIAALEAVAEGKPTELVYGTVITVNPLQIDIDQKQPLGQEFLLLTRNVTDHKTQISFDNPGIKNKVEMSGSIVNNTLITNPDTALESSTPAKFTGSIEGNLSYAEKIKHDVTIYNALKEGEKVILIRVQGGQKYLVLDRVVEI